MEKFLLILFSAMLSFPLLAQNTDEDGYSLDFQSEGIWYTILNESEKTCQTKAGKSEFISGKIQVTYGNSNIGEVIIPATAVKTGANNTETSYTVVGIGQYSFGQASSIVISEGIQSLESGAFAGNVQLSAVKIPSTITTISKNAFAGCTNLTSLSLPETLLSISNNAFSECSSLASIKIPESVTTIGDYAFSYCKALTTLVLPNSVTSLGKGAFQGCEGLTSVTLSENVTALPTSLLSGCNALTTILIPANVNSIGAYALNGQSLRVVTSHSKAIPALSANSFSAPTYANGTLMVYKSAIDAYQTSSLWSAFKSIEPIYIAPTQVAITPSALVLNLGLTGQLNATLAPEDATGSVVWEVTSTTPEGCVAVDENGLVTARKIGTATVTASCGSVTTSCTITVNANPSQSVTINPVQNDLYVGDAVTMTAVVLPTTIDASDIKWSSSNPDIASIDEKTGELTGIAPGAVIISAECQGITGKLQITVLAVEATAVTLNHETLTLIPGESAKLSATIEPDNVTYNSITWETSDPSVAVVSDGEVTALNAGTATIRARCGNITANCEVTVNPIMAKEVILTTSSAKLQVNQTLQLGAVVTPDNTTDKTITWTTNNPEVATVSTEGVVTANALGSATITATCGSVFAECSITVVETPATSVVLNYAAITLKVSKTQQLTATVPDATTNKTITWTSSDTSVASVSTDGLVTALEVGSATITASCGSASATCEVTVEPTPAEQIVLDNSSASLNVNQTLTLKAAVYPETTTDAIINWTSDNPSVATVDNDGTVTAVATGVATIYASCGMVYASCSITVLQPATAISLNMESMTLEIGDMDDLIAIVTPENTTDILTWSSDNESVAIVNEFGIVTGVSIGETTVTATCGQVSATCKIIVTAVEADEIILSATEVTLKEGQSQQITAIVSPENTTYPMVSWTSADETVATVSNDGTITAVKSGNTTITASCGKTTATVNVIVQAPETEEIIINYTEITLKAADAIQLEATLPTNMSDQSVTWATTDPTVAMVSSTGLVTAVAVGETTITATAGSLTAFCKVIVEETPVEYIELDQTSLELVVEQTYQLYASVYPETATDKSVVWTSSDESVATVSEEGIVTALTEGYTTITVSSGTIFVSCSIHVGPKITDAIINISQEEDAVYRVYTITGINVMTTKDKSDINRLEAGLYIINGKKYFIRK